MNEPNCKICDQITQLWFEGVFDDRYGYPGYYNIYRCSRCSFAQLSPEPTAAAMAAMYTSYYPRHSVTPEQVQQSAVYRGTFLQRLGKWWMGNSNIAYHHVQSGDQALDIGCGNGSSLLEMAALGAQAHGTEYDENIRSVATALQLDIHFGDLNTAPWPEHTFDVITMNQLLEHTPDPIEFLRLTKQLLKPTGKVVMSFPNVDSANCQRTKKGWINWHAPYHVNFFSKDSIYRLAAETGFTVSLIRTVTPNGWLKLQYDSDHYQSTPGKASPVWTGAVPRQWWHTQAVRLWFSGLAVPYFRWVDYLGKGDSWLVILTVK